MPFMNNSKVDAQKNLQNEGSKRRSLANETIINLFKTKIDVLLKELQTVRAEYKKKVNKFHVVLAQT